MPGRGRTGSCDCTSSTCCRPCRRTPPSSTSGVPARGLHGEAYRGHVFWDELFVLPYLNLHLPEVSRALLDVPPPAAARRRPRRGAAVGRTGRHVPVAERQRRPRGDPDAAPQPPLRPLARPTTRDSSTMSDRRWPTTSGSTARPPATPGSCTAGRGDAAADRPLLGGQRACGTRRTSGTGSAASSAPTSTTTRYPGAAGPASTTTRTPTSPRPGCCAVPWTSPPGCPRRRRQELFERIGLDAGGTRTLGGRLPPAARAPPPGRHQPVRRLR